MRIQWAKLAVSDLDTIGEHIAVENYPAPDIALDVINTTENTLLDHPQAGKPGRVSDTRELAIDGIPFTVVYRQADTSHLQVLRVLHDTEQWPQAN